MKFEFLLEKCLNEKLNLKNIEKIIKIIISIKLEFVVGEMLEVKFETT